jgi:hypothetical protein
VNRIVIEIPDELKTLVEPIEAMVADVSQRCRASRASGRSVDYARAETAVGEGMMAIERAAHGAMLSAIAVDAAEVLIGGKLHKRVLRSTATYRTMAGPVQVERGLYRPVGERNAPTVDPIGARVGVIGDGWLPATAMVMAHAVQMATPREAEQHAKQQHRLPYSRSSFQDVTHLVGQHYVDRREPIETELIERYEVPEAARSMSISLDRVSIPMEEPRPRPRGRPRAYAPRNPIKRVFRMAYCATLTLHDEKGEGLHTLRYGRMSEGDVAELVRSLTSDAMTLLDSRPDLKVVTLSDGAPEMWQRLATADEASLGVDRIYRYVDFWHVVEKLTAAAQLMDRVRTSMTMKRWKMLLLNRRDAVDTILAELEGSGRSASRINGKRPVGDAITYLKNQRERMHYTEARWHGLPIGSGAVEATCKSLVTIRMKRSGARWKQHTGEHIIELRALAQSDRWDEGVRLALKPLRMTVRKAAA